MIRNRDESGTLRARAAFAVGLIGDQAAVDMLIGACLPVLKTMAAGVGFQDALRALVTPSKRESSGNLRIEVNKRSSDTLVSFMRLTNELVRL